MKKYTMAEFKKKFRPEGYGEMILKSLKTGNIVSSERIYEVLCDTCLVEIGENDTVYMPTEDWVLCEKCAKKKSGN